MSSDNYRIMLETVVYFFNELEEFRKAELETRPNLYEESNDPMQDYQNQLTLLTYCESAGELKSEITELLNMETNMNNGFFKQLNHADVVAFRKWARENYIVGGTVNPVWHPVTRMECELMNAEVTLLPDVTLIMKNVDHPSKRYIIKCSVCAYSIEILKVDQSLDCPNCEQRLDVSVDTEGEVYVATANE